MLIRTVCPQCQFAHEVSDKRLGDTIGCQRCGEPLVVVENKSEEAATFEVESIFRSEDGLAAPTPTANPLPVKPAARFNDGRHSLVVPPPPKELWSAEPGADESSQRWRTFRHDSTAVEKFLARDEGSDYSWLLVTGLVMMALLICTFQVLLGFLIVFVR
jgi:hypothetical protein